MIFFWSRIINGRNVIIMQLKKIFSIIAAAAVCGSLFAGCASNETADNGSGDAKYNIGVLQYADHPSLENCLEGFTQGLDSEGISYELTAQSAKNDDSTNTQIAQQFASKQMDLVCGIATPSAQACYNACFEAGIPVIFNAVSDPVAAKLAESETQAMDGITGVSDKLPVEAQLELIREMLPEAKKIGILYTTSEANSVSTIEDYKAKVADYGFELVERGITNAADIPQAVDILVNEVDCITNMTDNTVVNNLPVLIEKATASGVPVFGSEEEQVGNGCIASAGIDYIELGRKAGVIAARVLNGEDVSSIPYETMTESKITINPDAAEAVNVEIPQSITDRAEVKTAPSEES